MKESIEYFRGVLLALFLIGLFWVVTLAVLGFFCWFVYTAYLSFGSAILTALYVLGTGLFLFSIWFIFSLTEWIFADKHMVKYTFIGRWVDKNFK